MSAIVDKIRKLLALATSANEHEAASAAAMAQRLMIEHAVSEESVRGAGAREDEGPIETEILQRYASVGGRSAIPSWHQTLAGAMSRHFLCRIWYTPGQSITMVGRPSAREIFRVTYFYVRGELERLCEAAWSRQRGMGEHGKRWKTSFYAGAVSTINARLREETKRLEAGTPTPGGVTSSGLVLAPPLGAENTPNPQTAIVLASRVAEVDLWVKSRVKLHAGGGGGQRRPSWSAYREGQAAGHAVSLGKRATKAIGS